MKRFFWCAVALAVLAGGLPGSAQILNTSELPANWQAEADLLRRDLRAEKRDIVSRNMQLTPSESEQFWPIYQEYEAELQLIWNKRIALIAEYASLYPDVTDAQADALIEESLTLDDDIAKLRKAYYRKFKKELSGKTVARFIQLDRRINSLLELQVANSIPLVQ